MAFAPKPLQCARKCLLLANSPNSIDVTAQPSPCPCTLMSSAGCHLFLPRPGTWEWGLGWQGLRQELPWILKEVFFFP